MTGTIWWPVFGTLVGLVMGSFIATLVIRWPQGRSIGGRSCCDGCGATLRWHELVPIVSGLVQRGRCRRCGAQIDKRHFGIEAVAALIGLIALTAAPGPTGAAGAVFGWQLLALGALDTESLWLPDPLTGALAVTGVGVCLVGLGVTISEAAIGGLAGFGALALIAWAYERLRGRTGMGGGDPKLLGAIGLWLGWRNLPFVLFAGSALGLAIVFFATLRGRPLACDARIPLGALLAIAAFPAWVLGQTG